MTARPNSGDDDLPPIDDTIRSSAWCGRPADSPIGESYDNWGLTKVKRSSGHRQLSATDVDDTNWKDPNVGWGIILPDNNELSAKDKACAADAPKCIQELLAERGKAFAAQGGAPVFRYQETLDLGLLARFAPDGTVTSPGLNGRRGVSATAVPKYLLIVGSPKEIPWRIQYRLQLDAYVGRLDLDPAGLDRYVEALLSNWCTAKPKRSTPVVWAVDYGRKDITRTMRRTIADQIVDKFTTDPDGDFDMSGGYLTERYVTASALMTAIGERSPAFITTTSHGVTAPISDPTAMAVRLGLPLDAESAPIDPSAVMSAGSTHGAIWYAHACCSAGCDDHSSFAGIASPESDLGLTLAALEKVEACTAPLPRQLLGGPGPARAFVGHVEPTFEWTLFDPRNKQATTAGLISALYGQLHRESRPPIGYALDAYWRQAGGAWREYSEVRRDLDDQDATAEERVKRAKLVASDREAMVLLGDPTVRCE